MVEASIVLGEKGAKAEAPPRLGTALLESTIQEPV